MHKATEAENRIHLVDRIHGSDLPPLLCTSCLEGHRVFKPFATSLLVVWDYSAVTQDLHPLKHPEGELEGIRSLWFIGCEGTNMIACMLCVYKFLFLIIDTSTLAVMASVESKSSRLPKVTCSRKNMRHMYLPRQHCISGTRISDFQFLKLCMAYGIAIVLIPILVTLIIHGYSASN